MAHRTLLLAAAILFVTIAGSGTANAQTDEGWYFGFWAGYSDTDDTDFETGLGTVTTTFDSSVSYGIAGGYQFPQFRVEGELSFRDADVENHILGGGQLPGPTGEVSSQSIMGNLFYDFNRGGAVQPYLGLGLGFTDVEFEGFGVTPIPQVLGDSDSSFAYQFMAGLGIPLSDTWNLFVDYRYFAADDLSVTVSQAAGGLDTDIDYQVQDFNLGFRVSF